MNKYLYCQVFLFANEQQIFLVDGKQVNKIGVCDTNELAECLVKFCNKTDTYKVKIMTNEAYSKGLTKAITKYNSLLYGNKNIINIEVIH